MTKNNGCPRLEGKRVLVTGGSGFIGSHLVEGLLDDGCTVAAVAHAPGRLAFLNHAKSFLFFSCELLNFNEVQRVLSTFEPEIVIHLAAHPDGREDYEQARACIQNNLSITLNVLEAFRLSAGECFIYGDSCKVYDGREAPHHCGSVMRPLSSYGIAKRAGWEICDLYRRVHGVATISVRPTMIHGPRQPFNLISYVVECVLKGKSAVVLDGGDQTRDLLFVKDAVDAYLRILAFGNELAGRVIHLGGGCELRIADIARMVLDIMGSDLPVVAAPERTRPTELFRSSCNNDEAFAWLGWRPSLDLHTALEKTVHDLTHLYRERAVAVPAMMSASKA
jgi:UDP-glucose 4-epimerase